MGAQPSMPPPVTAVLAAAEDWLPARMAEVETRLAEVAGAGGALAGAATDTLTAGGKRMRPILVLLCAGDDAPTRTLPAATAVELIHMATLVHDDVLDDAPLRRGRPTVYADGGRGRAVSVGDYLLSQAFAVLVRDIEPGDIRLANEQVRLLTAASIALARGELVQRRDAFDLDVTVERYEERCRLKTATLFECACRIAHADDHARGERLAGFGDRIGLAFQMFDDILDVAGPPSRTGKARGTDLLDGTITLPFIIARERDPELGRVDMRKLDAAAAENVCDRIAATGALDEVRERALALVEDAKKALDSPDVPDSQAELLSLVADGVVHRYS